MQQQGGARTSGQGGGWVSRPKYDRRAAELKDGIMVKLEAWALHSQTYQDYVKCPLKVC